MTYLTLALVLIIGVIIGAIAGFGYGIMELTKKMVDHADNGHPLSTKRGLYFIILVKDYHLMVEDKGLYLVIDGKKVQS